jgi:CRP/FNR family cyclic AMP-dependent transcriptional regulator
MTGSPISSPSALAAPAAGLLFDLFNQGKVVELGPKRKLFQADDICDGIYRVAEGLLKVTVMLPSKHHRILSIAGPASLIGEVSLLDRGPRSATVTAIRPSKLEFVSLASFDEFGYAHPEIYREIAGILARRLRDINAILALDALSIKGRTARAILSLAEAFGKDVGSDRILVRQRMSQSELAAMAGIARENLSRTLKEWGRSGWISRLAGYYCLENKAALAREAEL